MDTPASPAESPNRWTALAVVLLILPAWSQEEPSIGYATVAEAFVALSGDPEVTIQDEDGWTVAESQEGDDIVLWTFTTSVHSAHPSAVKRILHREDGNWMLEMMVLCEADNEACDELVTVFQKLNESMKNFISNSRADPASDANVE